GHRVAVIPEGAVGARRAGDAAIDAGGALARVARRTVARIVAAPARSRAVRSEPAGEALAARRAVRSAPARRAGGAAPANPAARIVRAHQPIGAVAVVGTGREATAAQVESAVGQRALV